MSVLKSILLILNKHDDISTISPGLSAIIILLCWAMALYQNNKYHLLINITAGLYKRNECKQSTKPFHLDVVMLPRLSALLCNKFTSQGTKISLPRSFLLIRCVFIVFGIRFKSKSLHSDLSQIGNISLFISRLSQKMLLCVTNDCCRAIHNQSWRKIAELNFFCNFDVKTSQKILKE